MSVFLCLEGNGELWNEKLGRPNELVKPSTDQFPAILLSSFFHMILRHLRTRSDQRIANFRAGGIQFSDNNSVLKNLDFLIRSTDSLIDCQARLLKSQRGLTNSSRGSTQICADRSILRAGMQGSRWGYSSWYLYTLARFKNPEKMGFSIQKSRKNGIFE